MFLRDAIGLKNVCKRKSALYKRKTYIRMKLAVFSQYRAQFSTWFIIYKICLLMSSSIDSFYFEMYEMPLKHLELVSLYRITQDIWLRCIVLRYTWCSAVQLSKRHTILLIWGFHSFYHVFLLKAQFQNTYRYENLRWLLRCISFKNQGSVKH